MPRCAGITRSGDQCTATASAGATFCYLHDPGRSEERSRNAAKAAKAKGGGSELVEVKAELRQLFTDVRRGAADPRKAAVAAQVANALLRALALERELKETEELVRRVEELEASL